MNTKIVYIVVSDISDTYIEQALVSIYSLRVYNPNAIVEVVVDHETYQTLEGNRAYIKQLANTIVPVNVPQKLEKMQRSRFLKTNLRNIISGDYLFIDTDTVIIGDLSMIDSVQDDIAMAYNTNTPFPVSNSNRIGDKCMKINSQKVGWKSLVGNLHYNSGVLFAKDNSIVRRLYQRWHENWLECVKHGVNTDQMALVKTNEELGEIICRLEDTYNWQIQRHGCRIPEGTKILHYFASDYNHTAFIIAQDGFLRQIKNEGFPKEKINYYLDNIDEAFAMVTVVVSEKDYNLLKEIRSNPLYQIRESHPIILNVLNKLVMFFYKIKHLRK